MGRRVAASFCQWLKTASEWHCPLPARMDGAVEKAIVCR